MSVGKAVTIRTDAVFKYALQYPCTSTTAYVSHDICSIAALNKKEDWISPRFSRGCGSSTSLLPSIAHNKGLGFNRIDSRGEALSASEVGWRVSAAGGVERYVGYALRCGAVEVTISAVGRASGGSSPVANSPHANPHRDEFGCFGSKLCTAEKLLARPPPLHPAHQPQPQPQPSQKRHPNHPNLPKLATPQGCFSNQHHPQQRGPPPSTNPQILG